MGLSRGIWGSYVPFILHGETLDKIGGFINVSSGLMALIAIPVSFHFVRWRYIPCLSGITNKSVGTKGFFQNSPLITHVLHVNPYRDSSHCLSDISRICASLQTVQTPRPNVNVRGRCWPYLSTLGKRIISDIKTKSSLVKSFNENCMCKRVMNLLSTHKNCNNA